MSAVYDYLVTVRDKMATISGVKTSKIGLERGVGSKDAPFIRIVPLDVKPQGGISPSQNLTYQVVFGVDTKNRDYEELHDQYFSLAEEIIADGKALGGTWVRTVTDQDTVQNLKTAVVEFQAVIDAC